MGYTTEDDIRAALIANGGEVDVPTLLRILPQPVRGYWPPLERMKRSGEVTLHDAGKNNRAWAFDYGCAGCDPICEGCNSGPLLIRAQTNFCPACGATDCVPDVCPDYAAVPHLEGDR